MATADLRTALQERENMLQYLREETARIEEEIRILSAAAKIVEQSQSPLVISNPQPVLVEAATADVDIRKVFP